MDPSKIKGVADWPIPRNPTEICQFLGFTGYYWYFIPNYSKIAWPLLDWTRKAVNWEWGEPQRWAVEELKTCMCAHPVLAQPDFNKQFYLQTDASVYGMGAVLSQEGEAMTSQTKTHKPKLLLCPLDYPAITHHLVLIFSYHMYHRTILTRLWLPLLDLHII